MWTCTSENKTTGFTKCRVQPRRSDERRWGLRESLFVFSYKSINTTVDQYRLYLQQVGAGSLDLANCDFDTGKETKAAEYSLTDETYAKLLSQLSDRKFDLTSSDLRDNILNFYSDLSLPLETKKDSSRWQSLLSSLDQLKLATPTPTLAVAHAN